MDMAEIKRTFQRDGLFNYRDFDIEDAKEL
jgi:hypothetical protein